MKNFMVTITETLQREICVEADSEAQALRKILDDYDKCNIVLNADDFIDAEFDVTEIIDAE